MEGQTYQDRLDALAEMLRLDRLEKLAQPMGAEAVNGMFIQDVLFEGEE